MMELPLGGPTTTAMKMLKNPTVKETLDVNILKQLEYMVAFNMIYKLKPIGKCLRKLPLQN